MTHAQRENLVRRLENGVYSVVATLMVALALALPALMWTGCGDSGARADRKGGDTFAGADAYVTPASDTQAGAATASPESKIKRGEYMVTIGGCNDCHTPMKEGPKGPEWDMTRMLSGHPATYEVKDVPTGNEGFIAAKTGTAFTGAWGTSFAMNLTPDTLTGIGSWTEEIFINTIRSGKHWGAGRPIMPPMPWFNYAKLSDEDISAVYAYLRTVPPISNKTPEYRPPTQKLAAK